MLGRSLLAALGIAVAAPIAWGLSGPRAHESRARTSLHIRGHVAAPMRPGLAQRLDLTLVNRRGVRLLVTRVLVRAHVDERHARAGCTRRDYAIRPVPRAAFPFQVGPHRTLRLGKASPRLRMKNLRRNQDACQGATLFLRYVGWVRRPR